MVSTRGRYALRVLVDLAEQDSDRYITLREIAERQEISEKYLESIVKELVKAGCDSLPELFASYAGSREEVMPAFESGEMSAKVRPEFFLTKEIPKVSWIDKGAADDDIYQNVMREIRSSARGAKVTMTITKVRVGLKDSYFKLDLSKYPNAVVIRN